jgi:hypothetical protein
MQVAGLEFADLNGAAGLELALEGNRIWAIASHLKAKITLPYLLEYYPSGLQSLRNVIPQECYFSGITFLRIVLEI